MARIAGVNLPREKRLEVGLTYIYGVGPATARKVATELGPNVAVEEDASVRKGQVHVYVGTDYSAQDDSDVDAQGVPGSSAAPPSSSAPPITAGGLVCVN